MNLFESRIEWTVNKPLQAVPALPRFLTVGDTAQAAVLVHNNTPAALEVVVTLTARGVELSGGARQTVKVAAGASRRAAFPVVARRSGQAGSAKSQVATSSAMPEPSAKICSMPFGPEKRRNLHSK